MIKIIFQRDKCIGCNSCVTNAPNNWKINEEDGKAELLNSKKCGKFFVLETSDDEFEDNKRASEDCPVNIIEVKK